MPCCSANDGERVLATLREARAVRGLVREVFITETRCLGVCPEKGATVVVYPDGTWYVGVAPPDVAEIVEEHLVAGRRVERLCDRRFD